MSKRSTSNINETTETRGNLVFHQEGDSTEQKDISKSIKKAAFGRDISARARELKYRVYRESPTALVPPPVADGWPTNVATTTITTATTTLTSNQEGNTTPTTGKVLFDFGKMALNNSGEHPLESISISNNEPATRTATKFEDTLDSRASSCAVDQADKNPMNLMVRKPDRLIWRNRTSTIEALDLGSLDDDPILQGHHDETKRRYVERFVVSS